MWSVSRGWARAGTGWASSVAGAEARVTDALPAEAHGRPRAGCRGGMAGAQPPRAGPGDVPRAAGRPVADEARPESMAGSGASSGEHCRPIDDQLAFDQQIGR